MGDPYATVDHTWVVPAVWVAYALLIGLWADARGRNLWILGGVALLAPPVALLALFFLGPGQRCERCQHRIQQQPCPWCHDGQPAGSRTAALGDGKHTYAERRAATRKGAWTLLVYLAVGIAINLLQISVPSLLILLFLLKWLFGERSPR